MGFFSFLKGKTQTFPAKSEIEANLSGVDFDLARDEIANIFHIGIEEGKKKGESLIAKKEFVEAWEIYNNNPCVETAINLLEIAPIFWDVFERCKPVGTAWFFKSPAVSKLAKAIIDATNYCSELFKVDMERNYSSEKDRYAHDMMIYFKFFYFFMHIYNRIMLGKAGFNIRSKFNEQFGPLMVAGAVESIIGHWPKEIKENTINDVFNELNSAEIEYSTGKDIMWNKDVPFDRFTGDSLLAKLTGRIVPNCGLDMFKTTEYKAGNLNPENVGEILDINLKVINAFAEAMKKMKIDYLIEELAKTIKESS